MTRKKQMRLCPANGCTEHIQRHQAYCRTHWFWLPKPLREAINDTWRKGRSKAWLENVTESRRIINERVSRETAAKALPERKDLND